MCSINHKIKQKNEKKKNIAKKISSKSNHRRGNDESYQFIALKFIGVVENNQCIVTISTIIIIFD